MLHVEQIDVFYGNVLAVKQVSVDVRAGEMVALIGANGAGKSTVLKAVSGLVRPTQGAIRYLGESIEKMSVEKIVARGVFHVPEGRRIFPGLTVLGNLEVATSSWRKWGEGYQAELENVYALFPRLREKSKQLGWSLSGGEQQMLAIGRGLMARPRLLLLDEPSLGLAPRLVGSVFDVIRKVNKQGVTLLLIEQNAFATLQISDRAYVLENGRVVLSGPSRDLAGDEKVKKAYLGG